MGIQVCVDPENSVVGRGGDAPCTDSSIEKQLGGGGVRGSITVFLS